MALIRVLTLLAIVVATASAKNMTAESEQLQAAVSNGHRLGAEHLGVVAIEVLLDRGLNVNARDRAGWTALMTASLEGLPLVVEALLDSGANPAIRSSAGETALIVAAGCFIVRTRADLVEERGFGPEMRARQLDAPRAIVDTLIRHGADVNAATDSGRTALMSAAMHGWADVARSLIAAHAKVNAQDKAGRIALDYADPSDVEVLTPLQAAGSRQGGGHSGRTVCDAQTALNLLGLRSGHPDCLCGPATANAVRQFQKPNGLPVTGELDSATTGALRVRR